LNIKNKFKFGIVCVDLLCFLFLPIGTSIAAVGGGPDHEGIQFIDLSFYLIIQSM
jgi:hypothetical protein